MLGYNQTNWTKKELLELLDKKHRYLTIKQLSEHFTDISPSTLKKACKELHYDLKHVYPNGEVSLEINQREGYKLHLKVKSFTKIYEYLFLNDIIIAINGELLSTRKISKEKFLKTYAISESQLRRKITLMNKGLADFDIKISMGKEITIRGTEKIIRFMHFNFLRFCYVTFDNPKWLEPCQYHIEVTENFFNERGWSYNSGESDTVGIWFYVNELAAVQGNNLILSETEELLFDCFSHFKKPDIGRYLSDIDWQFLLLSVYSWHVIDIELNVDTQLLFSYFNSARIFQWISIFENEIFPLSKDQKEFVITSCSKELILYKLYNMNSQPIQEYGFVDFEELENSNPHYMTMFNSFWDKIVATTEFDSTTFFKVNTFLRFSKLYPMSTYKKSVKVYIYLFLYVAYESYLIDRLNSHFGNLYHFEFVQEQEEADILISTVGSRLKNVKPHQKHIEILGFALDKEIYILEGILRSL